MSELMPGRKEYGLSDVSGNTDLRVCGDRTIRPRGTLIHTTSGTDSLSWLQGGSANAGDPASADFLIARWGRVYAITPSGRYAYHAGESIFTLDSVIYRDDKVSQILMGIEVECQDSQSPTLQQYDALAQLLQFLRRQYTWPLWYPIIGHYAVARPLGRRSDPVSFNWNTLRRYMSDESTNPR